MLKKLLLLAAIIAAIAAYFWFDLGQHLTLEEFKASQSQLDGHYRDNPALFIGGFFVLYFVVAAFSLPAAGLLSVVAGALFGVVVGTVLVSFASTMGGTAAFLASRFLLHDWVQKKFGNKLTSINDGLEKEGVFYLFTLRLIPAIPFFAVNLLMGLTKIRSRTFYWVSQLGMFPATIVFVNAGTELANIRSINDLLTPQVIGSFVALAIFPWIAKGLIGLVKRRRIYKGWKKPKSFDRNLIVLGAGSAGLVSSYIAATVKAKVTLIEANEMGGDCLNTGCVPSKALIKSARAAATMAHADRYGLKAAKPKIDFAEVMARVRSVITEIEPHDSVERFTGLGVDVVKGYAKFVDPWTVEIAGNDGVTSRMTAKNFVVATGAAPFVPPLPGIEESNCLTSETMWDALSGRPKPPAKMIIMGGGPIGCELAQSFQRLGSEVVIVEMADRLLGKEDPDAAALILEHLRSEGVDVRIGQKAVRVQGKKKLIVETPDGEGAISYDELIVAVGRRARVAEFGLEELGLLEDGRLPVDEHLATMMPHIYVAGDVAGNQQLTHGASHEAWYASVNALASPFRKYRADYRVLPRVTYTDPEVATVGLTEDDARAQDIEFAVTRYDLDDLDRAIAESETSGFVKVLTPPDKDTILGVTIVASHAGEMLGQFTMAMRHNMPLGKIMATIAPYPTWGEAGKFAAGQYRLERKPEKLLSIAQTYFNWRRS